MKSHAALWIDSHGILCDAPPSSGFKIAGAAGVEIPSSAVEEFNLTLKGKTVMQDGKKPQTPASGERLIADRELFADVHGELFDEQQSTGIKIADAGKRIPREYVIRYKLVTNKSKTIVSQSEHPHLTAEDNDATKAVKAPPNKGARGSGGLQFQDKKGRTTSSSAGAS